MEEEETIPAKLENMLLEYTICALRDNPEDLTTHAADYFTRLRNEKPPVQEPSAEESIEFIEEVLGSRFQRRVTVMGERYNPEEDDDDDEDVKEIEPKTEQERERILSKCEGIFLFRVLDKSDLGAVIDAMTRQEVQEGDIIIQQGDDGEFFYLIDRGSFVALIKNQEGVEKQVATYDDIGYFGELSLLHNQPRAATIKATTEGLVWAVNRKTFNKLIVKRAFEKRQMYMELLNSVSELKPLTEYERMQVADALIAKSYYPDEIIVNEGDEGDGMYFIVEGKVSVRQKKPINEETEEVEIAQLGKGEFFGELALVKHQPRVATVVAIEDTKTAFLDVMAFERLLGPCMEIMKRHTESYDKK